MEKGTLYCKVGTHPAGYFKVRVKPRVGMRKPPKVGDKFQLYYTSEYRWIGVLVDGIQDRGLEFSPLHFVQRW